MPDSGRQFVPAVAPPPEAADSQGDPRQLRALADAMPQLVWTANGDGVVDYYNSRAVEYAGIETTPEGTWEWRPVVHPDDRQLTVDAWTEAVTTGTLYQCEHRVCMADGEYRWHLSRGVPLVQDGRVIKWFGTATDVHSIKVAEAAVVEASRNKDEFLAVLAHELRNPLAPIRNVLELMRLEPLSGSLTRLHGILDRQISQMVRLVDDLLEMSRISRGEIRLELRPVTLADVIAAATETVQPALAAGGQILSTGSGLDAMRVSGDPVRLAQAFANLLHNAIKFTPAGGCIAVRATVEADRARVEIRDSGIGIEPAMLDRIFDMFTQVQPAAGRAAGGLGIGLALVRRIVELHGGDVTATSAGLGSGSSFVVSLPRLV